jgi:hypothetical protein
MIRGDPSMPLKHRPHPHQQLGLVFGVWQWRSTIERGRRRLFTCNVSGPSWIGQEDDPNKTPRNLHHCCVYIRDFLGNFCLVLIWHAAFFDRSCIEWHYSASCRLRLATMRSGADAASQVSLRPNWGVSEHELSLSRQCGTSSRLHRQSPTIQSQDFRASSGASREQEFSRRLPTLQVPVGFASIREWIHSANRDVKLPAGEHTEYTAGDRYKFITCPDIIKGNRTRYEQGPHR